jgi:hypothetical protein
VHNGADALEAGSLLLEHLRQAVEHRRGRILRRGEHFSRGHPATGGVDQDQIREGAADVDPEAQRRVIVGHAVFVSSTGPAMDAAPSL